MPGILFDLCEELKSGGMGPFLLRPPELSVFAVAHFVASLQAIQEEFRPDGLVRTEIRLRCSKVYLKVLNNKLKQESR